MVHEHLDIQSILQEQLKKERQSRVLHVQSVQAENHAMHTLENIDLRIAVNGETVPITDTLGPQQVESLLAFMVEDSMERTLKDAERDNIVYDGLGEHRILGKKKKKKKKKKSAPVMY